MGSLEDTKVQMKDLSSTPKYEPSLIERGWQSWWEANGYFRARTGDTKSAGETFVIVLPPPNITGKLHIGHGLMLSLQDVIVRYNRMRQRETVYVPGTDHAGIATQAVLERNFKGDETREEFLERAWRWQEKYESEIFNQLRRLGASCDFSRARFTLDREFSNSVNEAFVQFYDKGHIKRSYRIVNWCSQIKSTLSDLEVDNLEVRPFTRIRVDGGNYMFGILYYLKYPVIRYKEFVSRFGPPRREQLYDGPNKLMNYLELLRTENASCSVTWEGFEFIEIATTRPETILGDTALCVNESFLRALAPDFFQESAEEGAHGDKQRSLPCAYLAVNPLNFNVLPVIINKMADAEFGTGCLKITPAHDAVDFELQQSVGLKILKIIDEDNYVDMTSMSYWLGEGGIAQGAQKTEGAGCAMRMKRFDCRMMVLDILRANKLITREEGHAMSLPICSRTGDIVEPMLKSQWWLNCDEMARKALDATRSKKIALYPEEANRIWERWLENIKEWCLSRQLWWGHRIPAYRVIRKDEAQCSAAADQKDGCPEGTATTKQAARGKKLGWAVGRTVEEATSRATAAYGDGIVLVQDEDVLDTWFSSALWPFATLGWPDNLEKRYFPTSLLETGSDILFFWVARMVMCSLELCQEIPFKNVFLHGIVRDANGRKMSKSLGNVIDPLFIIEGSTLSALNESLSPNLSEKERKSALRNQKQWFPEGIKECGADALRFTLCSYVHNLKDINLDIKRVEGYRRFCNKLWNAFIFVRQRICNARKEDTHTMWIGSLSLSQSMEEAIGWIETKNNEAIRTLTKHLDAYNFMFSTQTIHSFFLYDFCDVFIEVTKRKACTLVLYKLVTTFVDIVKMLHPFMPFITEEIYQRLKLEARASSNLRYIRDIRWDESITTSPWPVPSKTEDLRFERFLSFVRYLRSRIGKGKVRLALRDDGYVEEIKALVQGVKDVVLTDCELNDFEGFKHQGSVRLLSREPTLLRIVAAKAHTTGCLHAPTHPSMGTCMQKRI
ncbi:UNVERIFIED_CONTAM: hypothetical protein PYX00_011782 [Menopon gallinae]|uniref:valine--tRNA ligase n=1 Tax=Menopon gallinae TaxID=328185 RepID=A0AAW2H8N3_9NEOP